MVAASAGPGAGEVDNGSDLRRLVTPPYPSTTTPLIPLQLIDPSPEAFDQEFKSFAWKCKTSLVFVSRCRSIGWIEVSRTPLSHHPGFVPPARWHLPVCAIDGRLPSVPAEVSHYARLPPGQRHGAPSHPLPRGRLLRCHISRRVGWPAPYLAPR